jgi:hypothetical protein
MLPYLIAIPVVRWLSGCRVLDDDWRIGGIA